ncbi:MAG TPA: HAD hydrolase family protein [Candidatus Saccharimonadales bacterium]|nr:HAD hydrolase family protein [Candidatus Saccharimonadales bacterium]
MIYEIPGENSFEINTIILDLNGTLTVGGKIPEGVMERLAKLKDQGFKLIFFTGNTRGDADDVARDLGIDWSLAKDGIEKSHQAAKLDPKACAAIGNGLIDLELMKIVKLRIVTLQAEGVHVQTLLSSDIVVPTINDALDLFIDQQRLIATLRK